MAKAPSVASMSCNKRVDLGFITHFHSQNLTSVSVYSETKKKKTGSKDFSQESLLGQGKVILLLHKANHPTEFHTYFPDEGHRSICRLFHCSQKTISHAHYAFDAIKRVC